MLANRMKTYNNLTMISLGVAIVGWLLSMLCNFAFYKAFLGFVLGTICLLGSEFCQICFLRSLWMPLDEVEEEYRERAHSLNVRMTKTLIWISVLTFGLFAFHLPLAFLGDAGYYFLPWLVFGSIFSVVALLLAYIAYTLWIKPLLIKKGILDENLAIDERHRRNITRIGKIAAVVMLVGLLIGGGIWGLNMMGWDSFADYERYMDAQTFKKRMESDYESWYKEDQENSAIVGGESEKPGNYYEVLKDYDYVYDNGEKVEFYYRRDLYYSVQWSSGHNVPVSVLTKEAYFEAQDTFNDIQSLLFWLFPADVLGGVVAYLILWGKDRKQEK